MMSRVNETVNIPQICTTNAQVTRLSSPVRDTGSDPHWGCLGLGTRRVQNVFLTNIIPPAY